MASKDSHRKDSTGSSQSIPADPLGQLLAAERRNRNYPHLNQGSRRNDIGGVALYSASSPPSSLIGSSSSSLNSRGRSSSNAGASSPRMESIGVVSANIAAKREGSANDLYRSSSSRSGSLPQSRANSAPDSPDFDRPSRSKPTIPKLANAKESNIFDDLLKELDHNVITKPFREPHTAFPRMEDLTHSDADARLALSRNYPSTAGPEPYFPDTGRTRERSGSISSSRGITKATSSSSSSSSSPLKAPPMASQYYDLPGTSPSPSSTTYLHTENGAKSQDPRSLSSSSLHKNTDKVRRIVERERLDRRLDEELRTQEENRERMAVAEQIKLEFDRIGGTERTNHSFGPASGKISPIISGRSSRSDSRVESPRDVRKQDMDELTMEQSFCVEDPVDENIIVPEYITALITTLKRDRSSSPSPADFYSADGFTTWRQLYGERFQNILCDLLTKRFLEPKEEPNQKNKKKSEPTVIVKVKLKIIEARGLLTKDGGKPRNAQCDVNLESSKDQPPYQTRIVEGSNDPCWNQDVTLTVNDIRDVILLRVHDRRKDDFLGQVKINVGDLISTSVKEGYLQKWYQLGHKDDKRKDKFVGGDILVEATLLDDGQELMSPTSDPVQKILAQLRACKVNVKSLYKILLQCCLLLDMNTNAASLKDTTSQLLSKESENTLKIMGRLLVVSEAYMIISYLELLFQKYKNYNVPYASLMSALETVHYMKRKKGWLSSAEQPVLVDLLDDMYAYYRSQVTKYKHFYPKNKPKGALETTILMLRMIHKNPVYKEAHPELMDSFTQQLKQFMVDAAADNYQLLQQRTAQIDKSVENEIEGILQLAALIDKDIEADVQYFKKAFQKEFDIVRLTAETNLKYFILTLESYSEIISSDDAVDSVPDRVFELFTQVRDIDHKYGELASFKRLSYNAGFNAEKWFAPFVTKWLEKRCDKILQMVSDAVKQDKYESYGAMLGLSDASQDDGHSSSIADTFEILSVQLRRIRELKWSNSVQNAAFLQKFSKVKRLDAMCSLKKTVNRAVEHYCDMIAEGEIVNEPQAVQSGWTSLAASLSTRTNEVLPKEINRQSCVKLCNIQYAMKKLESLEIDLDARRLMRELRNHRSTILLSSRREDPRIDGEKLSGQFKIEIAYGENVKPCNKNGTANPYVTVRVPENTEVPPSTTDEELNMDVDQNNRLNTVTSQSSPDGKRQSKSILSGKDCELVRTRVVYETINPTWNETFQCMVPPVDKLEVHLYSKNLLSSDEAIGVCDLDLSRHSRLRRKLSDHQTHDMYAEMVPQGRVLVRITLEGNDEDVMFWFRKSRERLGRMRDDFIRTLTVKISPFAKEVYAKAIKEQEAAPLPSKSFFSSLTAAVQYSNLTAAGQPIHENVEQAEANAAFQPLNDYLDKNIGTMYNVLSTGMVQEVMKRTWDENLILHEQFLVPPLYGQIEQNRRILNRRQLSIIQYSIGFLRDYFFAAGDVRGIPYEVLETTHYKELVHLIANYHGDLSRLRREYELSLLGGRKKELILRLIRLKIEKGEDLEVSTKEEYKRWFEAQLRGDLHRDLLLAQGSGSFAGTHSKLFQGINSYYNRDTPSSFNSTNPHANPSTLSVEPNEQAGLGIQREQNLLLDDDIELLPQHHHPLPEEMEDEEDLEMVRAVLHRSQLCNHDGAFLAAGTGSNRSCSAFDLASWESGGMDKDMMAMMMVSGQHLKWQDLNLQDFTEML